MDFLLERDPTRAEPSVFADSMFSVDGGNGAAAAVHTFSYLGDGHFGRREEIDNPLKLIA